MNTNSKKWSRVARKVVMTLGVTTGVAFGFAWYGETSSWFGEADADIVSSTFAPASEQERFLQSLRENDFAKPRMYNWDGNKVFFSSASSEKSPSIVARELQESFEKNGVNDKVYNGVPSLDIPKIPKGKDFEDVPEYEEVMTEYGRLNDGQIVPVFWSDNRVAMGGIEMEGDPEPEEILTAFADRRNIAEGMKRVRFVEAFRHNGDNRTTMTAMWSDDKLDMSKFNSKRARDVAADTEVPACPGCERVRHFGGTGSESNYVENVYAGRQPPKKMLRFYRKALTNRGWQRSRASDLVGAMEQLGHKDPDSAVFEAYARGGEYIHLVTYYERSTGKTKIHIMRQP